MTTGIIDSKSGREEVLRGNIKTETKNGINQMKKPKSRAFFNDFIINYLPCLVELCHLWRWLSRGLRRVKN